MLNFKTLVQRFGLYCVIGACAFGTDYCLFLAVLSLKANPYLANVVGICGGMAVSFTLNRRYNFRKTDALAMRTSKFIIVAFTGMAVSTVSIMLLLSVGVDVRVAKAVSMVLVFGMQFLANALWTFR